MANGYSLRMIELLMAGVVLLGAGVCWAAGRQIVSFPESGQTVTFLRDGQTYLELSASGWGPGWSHLGLRGQAEQGPDGSHLVSRAKVNTGAELTYTIDARPAGERQLALNVQLASDQDTELTMAILGLSLGQAFTGGRVEVAGADGAETTVELPLARKGLGQAVKSFTLIDGQGERTTFTFAEPVAITSDRDARIVLAERLAAEQPVEVGLTIDMPAELTYYAGAEAVPQAEGFDQWYPWAPKEDYAADSEIGLADWLDAPAGRHGRIIRDGDALLYNGQPIRLWGLNVCYSSCAPDKALAERRAAFYAKYGVNAVRLHKYADGTGWAGIQSPGSFVEFDAEGLDRMDYFIAQLKQHGIYVKLSSTFTVKLGPDDRAAVPYIDEFGPLRDSEKGRVGTGHGSVFLSREIQDLQITQIVKLLNHRNPYTGLTYAEDPAIAFVELFNEDSALFFGTLSRLQKIPTLRQRAGEMFFAWLKDRYGSEQALLEAWGERALNSFGTEGLVGESWEAGFIHPAGNPWFYDPDQLAGSQAPKRQRLMDTMLFLYQLQNDFYDRYVQAIREAGYDGQIIASNWQAGRAFSHYYNLHSDYRIGTIDRHNYFGGGGGGAKINNATMLRTPGSGMLSSGLQQVADRPFMLSEWIHVLPSEWGVEGPALIGAYGMGLQGWDVSFMFQNRDDGGFLDRIAGTWEVSAPQIMGVFPAVARQVLRGDVAESDLLAPRYVHVPSLHEGKLGFDDQATQDADVKTFGGRTVPPQALAVARCVIEFTDAYRDTPPFDLTPYIDGETFRSATGQLAWTAGQERLDGHVTVNTPATKAVIGFAAGQTCTLDAVTITPASRFAAIYVTARDSGATVAEGENLLIVAMARARNTGMKVYDDSRILARGQAPIVLEPVQARIVIDRPGEATVHVLDHDGARTGRTIPVVDGAIEIDTARDQTPYYLVSYAE